MTTQSISPAQEALGIVGQVRQAKGKAKIVTLKALANDDFIQFLKAVYDPMVTYGMTSAGLEQALTSGPSATFAFCPTLKLEDIVDALQPLAGRALTGAAAAQHLVDFIAGWPPEDQAVVEILVKAALNKHLDCGIAVDTINEAFPNLIATFDPMLAHKFEEKRIRSWPVRIEPKYDGVRNFALCNPYGESCEFMSRSGKSFSSLDHMKASSIALAKLIGDTLGLSDRRIMLDGEVMSQTFNETVSSVRKKGVAATDAVFYIFDFIVASDFESRKCSVPHKERRRILDFFAAEIAALPGLTLCPSYLVNSVEECLYYYDTFQDMGLEGAIVKPLDGLYEFKRSYNWLKLKAKETEDLEIVGAYEGEGKYVGMLGGVIVDFKGVQARVGGGWSDAQREALWKDFNEGLLRGRLIEVEFHEVTPDGSLRHSRFKRFRSGVDGAKF